MSEQHSEPYRPQLRWFPKPNEEDVQTRYRALLAAIAHCEADARLQGARTLERTQVRALAAYYADFIQTGNAHAKTP